MTHFYCNYMGDYAAYSTNFQLKTALQEPRELITKVPIVAKIQRLQREGATLIRFCLSKGGHFHKIW